MARAWNSKQIGHIDCPGGGQVWVEGTTLYVGHMRHPSGTSIYDVADPTKPQLLAHLDLPPGWHSHKVRAAGDVMIVNHERLGPDATPEFGGGLGIYDVSKPSDPRLLAKWRTHGKGVHRYDFDGRYAYISPTVEGYIGNIVMILDLQNPEKPEEVGRWWIPGQWEAGGEDYPWEGWTPPRCHHPLRQGDRLYVSYWHHGYWILDISDLSKPKAVAGGNTSPLYPHPTHTCLVMPEPLKGRRIMVVADEDVAKLWPCAPAFTWIYDITEERLPTPIATWQVEGLDEDGAPQPPMTGCHQPSERFSGSVIPFAWFAQGPAHPGRCRPLSAEGGGLLGGRPPQMVSIAPRPTTSPWMRAGSFTSSNRQRGVDIIESSVL